MSLNNLKKNLLFSSVENKELVDKMINEESKYTGNKPSIILERAIFDSKLTKNNQIRFWIINLHRECSSGDILSSVFEYNSDGINWKSCGLPLLPFIEFAIDEQRNIKKYVVDKDPIPHLLDCLDSIVKIIDGLKENCLDIESNLRYAGALEMLDYFIRQLNEEDERIQFVTYYRFFQEFWDDLKDSTFTFRALSDLTRIQKGWRNDDESRYLLTRNLRELAQKWPDKLI